MDSTLRFSFGMFNKKEEIDYAVDVLKELLAGCLGDLLSNSRPLRQQAVEYVKYKEQKKGSIMQYQSFLIKYAEIGTKAKTDTCLKMP